MRYCGLRFVLFLIVGLISAGQSSGVPLTATVEKDQVTVNVDGKLFTVYKFSDSQKYPYFWPVNGPVSGASITTETSEPYPHHHSLFFGCDRVNDGNYWQDTNERGQIISQGPKIETASGDKVAFTDECLWRQPRKERRKEAIIRDQRRIEISAPDAKHRLIDFQITLEPLVDITIQQTNHSLFSARVAPELSVKSGGTIVNAEGKLNEAGTYGIASPWCDYWGTRNGVAEGIAIFQHPVGRELFPANTKDRWYPSKWFTRDYGFFSPTPMEWLDKNEPFVLKKGETLTLNYRVVAHAGNTQEAGIDQLFKDYSK